MKFITIVIQILVLILSVIIVNGCGITTPPYDDAVLSGVSSLNRGKTDKALENFNRAIQIDPQRAGGYLGRGNTYNVLGQYEAAIADYNIAISIKPDQAETYVNRAIAYSHLKEYEKAIADYEKCLQLNPKIDDPPGIMRRLFTNDPNQERGIRKHLEYLRTQVKKS